jgi:hypothetical protein
MAGGVLRVEVAPGWLFRLLDVGRLVGA